MLKEALQTETQGESLHDLGVRCRYAFEHALREMPESEEAKKAYSQCLELLILKSIGVGDLHAAEPLMYELKKQENPDQELIARLEANLLEISRLRTGFEEMSTQIQYTLVEKLTEAERELGLLRETVAKYEKDSTES